ncbi:MAG: hypothetical protein ACHP7J_02210 [Terriglobales bacterium]
MPRMPAKPPADKQQEFQQAFNALRKILKPYDNQLRLIRDVPGNYLSESKSISYQGKPVMFAAITSKSYVAFHLFPVYMFPDLVHDISPALKKRMQGKTCWNFKQADETLFAGLGEIVAASFQRFKEVGERNLGRDDLHTIGKEHSKRK